MSKTARQKWSEWNAARPVSRYPAITNLRLRAWREGLAFTDQVPSVTAEGVKREGLLLDAMRADAEIWHEHMRKNDLQDRMWMPRMNRSHVKALKEAEQRQEFTSEEIARALRLR